MLSCLVYMSHTTTRLKFFNTTKKFYYGIFRFRFIPRKEGERWSAAWSLPLPVCLGAARNRHRSVCKPEMEIRTAWGHPRRQMPHRAGPRLLVPGGRYLSNALTKLEARMTQLNAFHS